jgi:hypothetical protein
MLLFFGICSDHTGRNHRFEAQLSAAGRVHSANWRFRLKYTTCSAPQCMSTISGWHPYLLMFCHILITLRPIQQCCGTSYYCNHDMTIFNGFIALAHFRDNGYTGDCSLVIWLLGSFSTNRGWKPNLLGSPKARLQPATLRSNAQVSYAMFVGHRGAHRYQRYVHEGLILMCLDARLYMGIQPDGCQTCGTHSLHAVPTASLTIMA